MVFKQANIIDKISKKELDKLKSIIAFGQYKGDW
jgi:hypothetical protein